MEYNLINPECQGRKEAERAKRRMNSRKQKATLPRKTTDTSWPWLVLLWSSY